MWLVLINHELAPKYVHSKPSPFEFPFASYSLAPCIIAHHFKSSDEVCKMFV
jgi:hypothetical protein